MENKIPDLSKMASTTLEMDPILIDGQKILFDKKVTLMPVTLEEKENGYE
ncbi:hypothetical protein [Flavivirga algicola]|nr:hypothetical protein [Flavivirga algicola]